MRYLAILFLITLSFPVSAEENIETEIDCDKTHIQMEMNICEQKAFKEAEREMEIAVERAIDKIGEDKEKRDLFLKSQQLWQEYRDINCDFETYESKGGGTIWPQIHADCMKRLTIERTEEIPKGFFEW